ncbi:hypothetical protein F5882DRAFT_417839 [Hyaloscypha sp. PMI_1271]|nr:hypothetical protein F5882DRAFT_417839 [Hyaloscypha sp. PMI_1271]
MAFATLRSAAVIGLPGVEKNQLVDESFFRGGFESQPSDLFIGIMGVTGAGKSTFIQLLSDSDDIKIGHGLESCTQEVTPYLYRYSDDINVYLIDTPGFDDTNRSDVDVLMEITSWLSESFQKDVKLSGMLYFHRITDPRMQGSTRKNLNMFQALCGIGQFRSVILVTTMWENVKMDQGEAREAELKENDEYWGKMRKEGSLVKRHQNTYASAKGIVELVVRNATMVELDIQKELVTQKKELHDTTAGKTLEAEKVQEREQWEKKEAKSRAKYKDALRQQKADLAEVMRKQKEEARQEVAKRNEDLERLKVRVKAADIRAQNERRKREIQEREQERLRKQNEALQKSVGLRIRSHPGPNRIQECRSVTLISDSYFFCGPSEIESKLPVNVVGRLSQLGFDEIDPQSSKPWLITRKFKSVLRLPLGVGVRTVALGCSDSFYVHFHKKSHCKDMTFLPDYPGLVEVLAKYRQDEGGTSFGCPRYLSLGVNGHYFIRSQAHSAWDLPKDLLEQSWWKPSKIKAV